MTVDLHMHSSCSDGALAPAELMQKAYEAGLTLVALTDHDTIEGVEQASSKAQELGMRLVSGIEFSSRWGRIGVHIVGLNLQLNCEGLRSAIARQAQARHERNQVIADKLKKLGVDNALERAYTIAGGHEPGRPHFAQVLIEDGKVNSVARAFKKYLGAGKLGDVKHAWPELQETVATIAAAGGVAVLAHPAKYGLTRTKLRALVADFAAAGGEAIEVISGMQVAGVAEDLAVIAREFNLKASVGSDFHKPGQAWQEMGRIGALPEGIEPVWSTW